MTDLERVLSMPYPIRIDYMAKEDWSADDCVGFIAFMIDIGADICSGTGYTAEEALSNLGETKKVVFEYLTNRPGFVFPTPSSPVY
jgi:hypothetical protein